MHLKLKFSPFSQNNFLNGCESPLTACIQCFYIYLERDRKKTGRVTVMAKRGSVSSQKTTEREEKEATVRTATGMCAPLLWRFPCLTAERQSSMTALDRGFPSLILRLTPNPKNQTFM